MKKPSLILATIILSSCNSYYFPLILETPQAIIDQFKPYELDQDYIEQQRYSFISAELDGLNATLMLNQIDDGVFKWVGRGGIILRTYKGFIIETQGLTNNVKLLDPKHSIDHLQANDPRILIYNLDDPMLFELPVNIEELTISKKHLLVDLYAKQINWDIKADIVYNDKGMPVSTAQTLHPFLGEISIKFYYKY